MRHVYASCPDAGIEQIFYSNIQSWQYAEPKYACVASYCEPALVEFLSSFYVNLVVIYMYVSLAEPGTTAGEQFLWSSLEEISCGCGLHVGGVLSGGNTVTSSREAFSVSCSVVSMTSLQDSVEMSSC